MAGFELHLERLPAGRSTLPIAGLLALAEAGTDDPGPQCRLDGELAVDAMGQKVLVHGVLEVERELDCHRCAQPSRQRYEAELEILILRSPHRGVQELTEDDAWVIHQQGGQVPLDRPLREAVFLHEPQRVLCREDCQGICPSCGTDRNTGRCGCTADEGDPRWAALRKLRTDSDPSDEVP